MMKITEISFNKQDKFQVIDKAYIAIGKIKVKTRPTTAHRIRERVM